MWGMSQSYGAALQLGVPHQSKAAMRTLLSRTLTVTIAAALLIGGAVAPASADSDSSSTKGDRVDGAVTKISVSYGKSRTKLRVDLKTLSRSTEVVFIIRASNRENAYVAGRLGSYTSFYYAKTAGDALIQPRATDKNLKKCIISSKAKFGKKAYVTFALKSSCFKNGDITPQVWVTTKSGTMSSGAVGELSRG
jgi:hypothetical protein